jgi:SAM-dependent methyltransferase
MIAALYAMMLDEIREAPYTHRELTLLKDPILYYGRYLNTKTRKYAFNNVVSNLSPAMDYLTMGASPKRLLDLGCGLGMQSILVAAGGWEVLGLDMNAECITLCRKRKTYFEARLGRELKLEFVALDFRKADPNCLGGKYGALFSMSAFAQIPPLKDTVAKISTLLSDTGRVCIWEENPGHFYSLLGFRRRRVPQPRDIQHQLAQHGFTVEYLRGGSAIPSLLWPSGALEGTVSYLDGILKKSWPLSFSYLLGASRGRATTPLALSRTA